MFVREILIYLDMKERHKQKIRERHKHNRLASYIEIANRENMNRLRQMQTELTIKIK